MKKLFLALILALVSSILFAQTVYKTPSGKKYHLAKCRMVKNTSAEMSVTEAIAAGLEPCKICNPQNTEVFKASGPSKSKGTAKTVQFAGITRSGNRCKHMTAIANGYCYQHQP